MSLSCVSTVKRRQDPGSTPGLGTPFLPRVLLPDPPQIGAQGLVRAAHGLLEANMSAWLDHFLVGLRQNRRGIFTFGFVTGLIVGLGSLAFAKLHKTLLNTIWNPRLPKRWGAHRVDTLKDEEFQPVEIRRSGQVVSGIAGMIGTHCTFTQATRPSCELTACQN